MKRLLLLLSLFATLGAAGQTTPAQDTTLITPSTAVTPQWRYATVNGYLTLQAYVNGKYYYMPNNKALRGYYGQLGVNNTWLGFNNFQDVGMRTLGLSSYGGTLIPGDVSAGNYIASAFNNGLFLGLTTKRNGVPTFRSGEAAGGGSFVIQKYEAGNWVNVFKTDSSSVTASNGLTKVGDDIQLGGALTTDISINGTSQLFDIVSGTSGQRSILHIEPNQSSLQSQNFDDGKFSSIATFPNAAAIQYLDYSLGQSTFAVSPTDIKITDGINKKGVVYNTNYRGNFTEYSLVDKGFVDSVATATIGSASALYKLKSDTTSSTGYVTKSFAGRYLIKSDTVTFARKTGNSSITNLNYKVNGTAGSGFIDLLAQSSAPTTPTTNHQLLYADNLGRFTLLGSNGFSASLSKSGLTATRNYLFPDSTGILAVEQRSYTKAQSDANYVPKTSNTPSAINYVDATGTLKQDTTKLQYNETTGQFSLGGRNPLFASKFFVRGSYGSGGFFGLRNDLTTGYTDAHIYNSSGAIALSFGVGNPSAATFANQAFFNTNTGFPISFSISNTAALTLDASRRAILADRVATNSTGIMAAIFAIGSNASFSTGGNLDLSGSGIRQNALTYSTGAAAGTTASVAINGYATGNIAATNATTITDAYGNYFNQPTAGTNVTFTRRWAAGFNGGIQVNGLLGFGAPGSALPSANQVYGVNAAGTASEAKTITAGAGISITNAANSITIAATPNVVEISGTSQTATGNTIYIPHNSSLTTITVPTTTTVGTLYQVIGEGTGGWRLQLPAGYTAVGVGSFTTTSGGSLNSTDKNCTITIRLTNTNKFTVTTSQGTINPL